MSSSVSPITVALTAYSAYTLYEAHQKKHVGPREKLDYNKKLTFFVCDAISPLAKIGGWSFAALKVVACTTEFVKMHGHVRHNSYNFSCSVRVCRGENRKLDREIKLSNLALDIISSFSRIFGVEAIALGLLPGQFLIALVEGRVHGQFLRQLREINPALRKLLVKEYEYDREIHDCLTTGILVDDRQIALSTQDRIDLDALIDSGDYLPEDLLLRYTRNQAAQEYIKRRMPIRPNESVLERTIRFQMHFAKKWLKSIFGF